MNATPPDDTLARLNYFNGQRLAAGRQAELVGLLATLPTTTLCLP